MSFTKCHTSGRTKAIFSDIRTHTQNKTRFASCRGSHCGEGHGGTWKWLINIDRKKIMPCVKIESLSPVGVGQREIGSIWKINGGFLEELFDLYFTFLRIQMDPN